MFNVIVHRGNTKVRREVTIEGAKKVKRAVATYDNQRWRIEMDNGHAFACTHARDIEFAVLKYLKLTDGKP